MRKKRTYSDRKVRIGILGGGAGGAATALELARRGHEVYIFEKNGDILLGSSNATPGRAGLGFHYIDAETGKQYINSTIEVLKNFPGCTRGFGKPDDHHMRHGMYFIMKDETDLMDNDKKLASLFPFEEIIKTYNEYKEHYAKKVAEDPSNEYYGDPEQFFKIRNKSEFEDVIDTRHVAAAVDTREELLDWPKVRERLCKDVNIHSQITVHSNTTVTGVEYSDDACGFIIKTKAGTKPNGDRHHVDMIVNASWENIESINHDMFFHMLPESRTNRLKVIVKVQLPEALQQKPSMFFCMGPHCMFSNMGDGTGMITYAPITNINSSTDLTVSEEIRSFLDGNTSMEEKMTMAKKVKDGVAKYIPLMKEAAILEIGFGIIRTQGTVDLFDPKSKVHERLDYGVRAQQIGWVDNACMKLLHFLHNAKSTADLTEEHLNAENNINSMIEQLAIKNNGIKKYFPLILKIYIERYFTPNEIINEFKTLIENLSEIIQTKEQLLESITKKNESKRDIISDHATDQKKPTTVNASTSTSELNSHSSARFMFKELSRYLPTTISIHKGKTFVAFLLFGSMLLKYFSGNTDSSNTGGSYLTYFNFFGDTENNGLGLLSQPHDLNI